jgi:putative acetyltransferase
LGLSSGVKTAKIGRAELPNFYIFIVLGHPGYYPTFGFFPASRVGIRCEYDDVLGETFVIMVLKNDVLAGASGVARYRPEFADVT